MRPLFTRLLGAFLLVVIGGTLALRDSRPTYATGPFAYVASQEGPVYLIDSSTNNVVKTIDPRLGANGGPAIAASPDGKRLYVTGDNATNSVAVIDTASNTVIATIPVGVDSTSIAVSPDGRRVYVANDLSQSISVIDTASESVVHTIAVGGLNAPTGLALSPDGARLYAAMEGSQVLLVFDTTTFAMVASVPVGGGPYQVAVSPDGTRAYVANQGFPGSVSVIDLTGTPTKLLDIPLANLPIGDAITPDGTRLYVSDQTGAVDVIDTATNTLLKTISVGASPIGLSVTPDGARVYAVNDASGTASVISTATNTVVATIGGLGVPFAISQFITPPSASATATASPSAIPATSTQPVGPLPSLIAIPVTGCGTVSPSGVYVPALQNVSVTAIPCPGSRFLGWSGGPCDKTTINPCSIPAGVQVTANFSP